MSTYIERIDGNRLCRGRPVPVPPGEGLACAASLRLAELDNVLFALAADASPTATGGGNVYVSSGTVDSAGGGLLVGLAGVLEPVTVC